MERAREFIFFFLFLKKIVHDLKKGSKTIAVVLINVFLLQNPMGALSEERNCNCILAARPS